VVQVGQQECPCRLAGRIVGGEPISDFLHGYSSVI
jgi:hypothetical protein